MCRTTRVVLKKFSYALQTDFNTLVLWCICKILPRKVEKYNILFFLTKKKHIDNVLSGPKLQTTNCTDTLSTAVTRHKQQTSGHRRTEMFFQIHAPGKCFVSSIQCPSFDGMHSIDNTSRQVLLSKEYFS